MTDQSLFADFEPLIGELKSRAGVALGVAYRRLNGIIKVPNQIAHELVRWGIWDGSNIEWNNQGGIKRFVPNARSSTGNPLRDSALLASSPVDFYLHDVLPRYNAMHLTAAQRFNESTKIFGGTGGALFSLVDKQTATIMKSRASYARAQGINSTYTAIGKTYEGRMANLTAKWQTLMLLIGRNGGVLDLAIHGLGSLTVALQRVNDLSKQHPMLLKWAVTGAAAFGVLALVGGALTNVVAGFRLLGLVWTAQKFPALLGGIVTGFRIMVGALAYLPGLIRVAVAALGPWGLLIAGIGVAAYEVYQHWDWIKSKLASLWAGIKNGMIGFVNVLIGLVNHVLPSALQIPTISTGAPAPGPALPPAHERGGRHVALPVAVNLGGKRVADVIVPVVLDRMTRQASRPNQGITGFDTGRGPLRVATP